MGKIKDHAIDVDQARAVIDLEIERLEVLQDDLSEFAKGCTDAQQEAISPALEIIMDRIALEAEKRDNLE